MDKLIGSYRITQEIARGGMGKVFKALHISLERTVAIKMIHPELLSNSKIVENFYNEAKIQAKLNHPNIATIYDFFEFENKHYVVMEFVEGESISRIIKHIGAFDIDIALSIFKQILSGLMYAHSKNVIHKDIKTSNFLLTPNTVKIIDFGIAQILDGSAKNTKTEMLIGTPNYMSPEQISGSGVDQRTDIYSLGVVFYELITGKVPFDIKTDGKDKAAVYNKPKPLREYNPNIPQEVESIIKKALEPDPDDRFQSIDEFLHAIYNINTPGKAEVKSSKLSEMVDSGSLSRNKTVELFCSLYYNKSTGILSIESERKLNVHFYNGHINFVEYRDPSLMLGEILVQSNTISEQERKDALSFVDETGRQIGECLVELGKITPHELNEILQNQIKEKIQVAILCKTGKYSFEKLKEPRAENIYNIYPLQIIYDVIYGDLLKLDIIENIKNSEQFFIQPTQNYLPETVKLKLSSLKEIKLSNILKQETNLKEAINNSPLNMEDSSKFLNFLYICNLIKIEKAEDKDKFEKEVRYYQSLQEDTTLIMSREEIDQLIKK